MRKLKLFGTVLGFLLLFIGVVMSYFAIQNLSEIRPTDCYRDEGIHTFEPYDILPLQVENHMTGRYQRMNPTRTVYMVYYQTTDGPGYQWQAEGGSVRELAEQVYNQGSVERRVLSIPTENTYITVTADQTAESYTSELRQRHILTLGVSGVYILVYLMGWLVVWQRKKGLEQKK